MKRLEPGLDEGLQELRLRLADVGRVDEGEDLALPDRIADLLEDAEDGAGSPGRKTGSTGLIVDELAVAGHELDHRRGPDGVDADARLLDGRLRRELDAAIMELAAARVLRPILESEGIGRALAIDVSDAWRRQELGDLGMTKRAIVDAVLRAPAERPARHEFGVALDAERLGDQAALAPVALLGGVAEQLGRFQQLPVAR